ncbi:peptidoglycan D,D-transpeptidase FtsI family protein [Leucobacter luti]|uniref:Cell elongation-specific peptidoglycan D,D-transpeptidase n=1 Tax=Leucobacter luti TaxID=340320 RepID=A0A4Q7U0Y0_9MICO|nr:penicillin-binding transpeptidase domain-containing protein [Leucobacter luti]MBL3699522.1 penicillin-binding protein [Leucobacter luti]RZT67034.1 cell elongation-specific peptidoglycan D,D-transpeptidase [Leucobacter luti]
MNKQLKFITRTVFAMFIALFFSVTMIQFVNADELRANELNMRTVKNSYKVERGSILVDGDPVAYSTPTDDSYRYVRQYEPGALYAPVTGYFSHSQGMTGLEAAMNQELSGIGNAQFFTRIQNTLNGVDPQGSSVQTTIDPRVQEAAAAAMADGGFEGAVVAIEPKTGRILALVSTPSFDPNLLSSNSNADIIANYRQLEEDPSRPLQNRAIAGDLYHPGSVYKLLVAAAAIENGDATPTTEYENPAQLTLPQSTSVMQNASRTACGSGAKATLEQAIMLSCNIPIAELAMSMDRDAVPAMARAFGFEQDLTVPLAVTQSVSPVPEDKAQTALASIGQLDVRVTPLQMAMVSAGIANGGTVMKPTVVDQVITPDLRVETQVSPEEFSKPISKKTADAVAGMMEKGVSSSEGLAQKSGIDGVRVAGKTGTAENGTDASGNDLPFTLWYTGFAPVDDPEIAVAVVIEDGGGEAYGYTGSSFDLPTAVGKRVMEAVLSE